MNLKAKGWKVHFVIQSTKQTTTPPSKCVGPALNEARKKEALKKRDLQAGMAREKIDLGSDPASGSNSKSLALNTGFI